MKTITLIIDDFSPLNHRFDVIRKLRDRFPEFKVTMMTVPWEIRYKLNEGGTPINDEKYSEWVNLVKHGIKDGWLEIGLHGFTHTPDEFDKIDEKMFKAKIEFAEKMFESTGIKLTKIFKPTTENIDKKAIKILKKMDYKVVTWDMNWNISDDFPVELDEVVGHGVVNDINNNGLGESLFNLVSIPDDYKFKFFSEVI